MPQNIAGARQSANGPGRPASLACRNHRESVGATAGATGESTMIAAASTPRSAAVRLASEMANDSARTPTKAPPAVTGAPIAKTNAAVKISRSRARPSRPRAARPAIAGHNMITRPTPLRSIRSGNSIALQLDESQPENRQHRQADADREQVKVRGAHAGGAQTSATTTTSAVAPSLRKVVGPFGRQRRPGQRQRRPGDQRQAELCER